MNFKFTLEGLIIKTSDENIDPILYKYFECVNFVMKSFNYSQDDTLKGKQWYRKRVEMLNVVQILK